MPDQREFKHIQLRMIKDAPPKKQGPRGFKMNPQTAYYRNNRVEHAAELNQAREIIIMEWQQQQSRRQLDNLPELPEALSIFLQVDPQAIPVESLRTLGIEVVGELEDGFIIGASSDLALSDLSVKIKKFEDGAQHNIAGLWKIVEGIQWKYERILSEELQIEWPTIKDDEVFVLDIGVACLGGIEFPPHPKSHRKTYQSDDRYQQAVVKWELKRDELYQQWDEICDHRYQLLMSKFITPYNGEDLNGMSYDIVDADVSLPDCFTVRVRINGKGLRDIVNNFPFVFDVSESDDIESINPEHDQLENQVDEDPLTIQVPNEGASSVCIIDSGIQERHRLLKNVIDEVSSRSWAKDFPGSTADHVGSGGHGTRVAGALLYPREIPKSGGIIPVCWIQNARVLESNRAMDKSLFQPKLMGEIVEHFHWGEKNTRIFNLSITATQPSRRIHMSAWAAKLDQLSWRHDIIFVVAAGNVPQSSLYRSLIRLSVDEHLKAGRPYPDYLLEPSSRIANPAQSLQAITVGSIGSKYFTDGDHESFSKYAEPSAFSCSGPGIFGSIKPEVVEFGGCFAFATGASIKQAMVRKETSPELVASTLHGGNKVRQDAVGTSFATPKVSHVLAHIQNAFPFESTLLYRALLVQSARWPEWTERKADKYSVIRYIGYGLPDLERATENTPYRITFITQGSVQIKGQQVHIYEVIIPREIRRQASNATIRIDITLSYKAQPRRTRRNRQRYLSTWLEWQTSRKNQDLQSFMKQMVELTEYEDILESEPSDAIKWTIGSQKNHGKVRDIHRNNQTIQKDWTTIQSYEWGESFFVAVIGHLGWNRDLNASVPYALAVSFEAINGDLEIYEPIMIANEVELEGQSTEVSLF